MFTWDILCDIHAYRLQAPSLKERKGVAVCCSVLKCVAVCCSVLQCAGSNFLIHMPIDFELPPRRRPKMLQCVAVCCSVLQCVAVKMLQCVAVCCSVLQCAAVCYSVLQ